MEKIVVSAFVSLDGVMEAPGGTLPLANDAVSTCRPTRSAEAG